FTGKKRGIKDQASKKNLVHQVGYGSPFSYGKEELEPGFLSGERSSGVRPSCKVSRFHAVGGTQGPKL
ncbi:hypothetical protein A2U01_0065946, partial [Trifolium medium]|nr:hypothetical protein [Trifolium medium]